MQQHDSVGQTAGIREITATTGRQVDQELSSKPLVQSAAHVSNCRTNGHTHTHKRTKEDEEEDGEGGEEEETNIRSGKVTQKAILMR